MFKSQKKENAFLFGLLLSLATLGFAFAVYAYMKNKKMSSQDVLKKIKAEFKKTGAIEGSWIEMIPTAYQYGDEERQVYYGGITRKVSGDYKQFEFVADAMTGQLLTTYPLD